MSSLRGRFNSGVSDGGDPLPWQAKSINWAPSS